MNNFFIKLAWLAIPSLLATLATAKGNPMLDNSIAIYGACLTISIVGIFFSGARKHRNDNDAMLHRIDKTVSSAAMMTYRMAVYDEHFTVDEKLQAYRLYRDAGGNHQTKAYMDSLLGQDVDVYLEKHDK